MGNAQQATACYRKAVQLNPGGAPAWMGLAEVAESSGNTHLAVQSYEQLVRHTKGSMEAPALGGVIRMVQYDGRTRTLHMMCCAHR